MSSPFIVIDEITSKINEMNTSLTTKIDNLIGATGNTGGSTTAGTVMAKLNAIIGNTATNNTASTTGTLSQKISSAISNTAATTTENSSGTLSAKLTYLINRRDKVITPSATNLKTLSNSGSVTLNGVKKTDKSTSISTNGTVYSCYVKYSGRYRAYFTTSLSWTNYSTSGSWSNGSQTGIASGYVYVYNVVSKNSIAYSVEICRGTGNVASTTKTVDFQAQAGDMVQMRVVLSENSSVYDICSEGYNYLFDTFTATWTDISIRGTVNEINGAVI